MILDWAMFVKICIVMQNFTLSWSTLVELVGIIFIASNLSSAQFAVAHEVMHKPGKFYRYLATLHMLKLCYTHFTYHHLYRHHQQVATPADPSTARKGETVYQFIVRCISGSWRGVYEDERRAGKKIIENYAVLSLAASFLFVLGVLLVFGLKSMLVHLAIAAGAIIYL
jgi:alkane 1-monooxygenase